MSQRLVRSAILAAGCYAASAFMLPPKAAVSFSAGQSMLGHKAGEFFVKLSKLLPATSTTQRLSVLPYCLHSTAAFQAQERVDASCVLAKPAARKLAYKVCLQCVCCFRVWLDKFLCAGPPSPTNIPQLLMVLCHGAVRDCTTALSMSAEEGHKYIIVGGGTAGCVLANRLSAEKVRHLSPLSRLHVDFYVRLETHVHTRTGSYFETSMSIESRVDNFWPEPRSSPGGLSPPHLISRDQVLPTCDMPTRPVAAACAAVATGALG